MSNFVVLLGAAMAVVLVVAVHNSPYESTRTDVTPEQFQEHLLKLMVRDLVQAAGVSERASTAIKAVKIFPRHKLADARRGTVRRGWFDRGAGILYVAVHRRDGAPLPAPVVAGVVVHEVAHACVDSGAHDEEWRRTYVRLLEVATRVLRWDVTLECSSCSMYGVCEAAQCPLCAWKKCGVKSSQRVKSSE